MGLSHYNNPTSYRVNWAASSEWFRTYISTMSRDEKIFFFFFPSKRGGEGGLLSWLICSVSLNCYLPYLLASFPKKKKEEFIPTGRGGVICIYMLCPLAWYIYYILVPEIWRQPAGTCWKRGVLHNFIISQVDITTFARSVGRNFFLSPSGERWTSFFKFFFLIYIG